MTRVAVPEITIFTGRFGSGKTEVAINYALRLAQDSSSMVSPCGSCSPPQLSRSEHAAPRTVILIDLDIVTPYFRSRDVADFVQEAGVEVIAPAVIGQHLDTPAITPEIMGAIQQTVRPVVLDVGGDRQGARALGQYRAAIRQRGYAMYFVVNPYRPFTDSLQGLSRSVAEIEASARLQVTGLVSNPNLMRETTTKLIAEGHSRIEDFAQELGLPIALVCIERHWLPKLGQAQPSQPILPLERHLVMAWE